MRKYVITTLILILFAFLVPWLTTEPSAQTEPSSDGAQESPQPDNAASLSPSVGGIDSRQMLRVLIGGETVEMDMATYLAGVVRAEMPAVFESEALKAQAVAARTYTIHKILNGGSENHPDADACDDITCCKAYTDAAAAAANWGTDAPQYEEKIRAAVRDTDGECILYEGSPILAVFHSSSVGATMDAASVWSEAVPYLVSVSSPENSETVPNYYTSGAFTVSTLKTLLQEALPETDLSGSHTQWFTDITRTPSGTVTSVTVGGVTITGNRLRTILGLRSPCFTISFDGDSALFSVTGYGHGVGMSQYGANVLASGGMNYREILAWYYTGTTVAVYGSPY